MEEVNQKIAFNWINIWKVLGFLLIVIIVIVLGSSILDKRTKPTNTQTVTVEEGKEVENSNMGDLKIEDIKVGEGSEVIEGNEVSVHYTGTLTDGKKFDSSLDLGQPFSFTVGERQVIEGWDKGLLGMKVGGKRKLTIPPEMGYGAQGAGGDIPPNSTLVFEIELLEIKTE